MINPDKHIRKYFYETLSGEDLLVFDSRQGGEAVNQYVLMTTQTKVLEQGNKCVNNFDATIVLEIVDYQPKQGNTGSRVWIDDTEEKIILSYFNAEIDNFAITNKNYNSNDLVTYGTNEIIKRKIITINFKLYQNEHNTN